MPVDESTTTNSVPPARVSAPRLNHLRLLEAESIHILREVASEFERPVMLYSIGKDSSVMLRLAQKAFYPAPIPFPLLHIDTGFKFAEMLTFRDEMARSIGSELLVWRNEPAIAAGTNPIALDTKRCCGLLKTQALLDALRHYNFDAAFGGARRDEEKSRAKERIYSFRDSPASGIRRISGRSCGTCTTRAFIRAKAFAFFRCRTGLRWTCGSTSTRKRFPLSISTSQRSAPCMCGATRCYQLNRHLSRGRASSLRW